MTDFPLIYCNGDSYSDENTHSTLKSKVYANNVAQECEGFLINKAIIGSCNRRIIRSTVYDMIHQRQLNPAQKIIALIGLTFDLRSEIWIDNLEKNTNPEESNLRTHTFSGQSNWRDNLLGGEEIGTPNRYGLDKKFYKHYSEGRAFFYSPYAERINLFCDLIMLRSFFESLNIDFLIFRSTVGETLEQEYLLDFFKTQLAPDNRFLHLDTFGFCDWSQKQGYTSVDFERYGKAAHPGVDGHKAFAHEILIPRLKELKFI
jgi:hypothetical protein